MFLPNFATFLATFLIQLYPAGADQCLTVHTASGTVKGFQAAPTVRAWKGVPYAEAPVGERRFKAPQRIVGRPATVVVQARSDPASCPNHKKPAGAGSAYDEDCLTLNIWSSNKNGPGRLAAVMVFFPGGGYITGGTSNPAFDGTAFVRDQSDILLVTINYRLGILGFPAGSGADPKSLNPGLQDQRAAVEWIYDNIKAFGGDRERITLFGESAGAASIASFMHAYKSNPIAHGIILDSGSERLNAAITVPQGHQPSAVAWSQIATAVGCASGAALKDQSKVFSCMQHVDLTKLINAVNQHKKAEKLFLPTQDGILMLKPEDYVAANKAGNFAKIPALIGTNTDEATVLLADYISGTYNDMPALVYKITQFLFTCPAAIFAADRHRAGVASYLYRYAGVWPDITPPGSRLGAYHTAELPLVFGNFAPSKFPRSKAEKMTSQYMQGAWAAFAKDPVHGLRNYGWPSYSVDGRTLIEIAANYVDKSDDALDEAQLPLATFQPSQKYNVGCEEAQGPFKPIEFTFASLHQYVGGPPPWSHGH